MTNKISENSSRINLRLDSFLVKKVGLDSYDIYGEEPCVEYKSKVKNYFNKYPYRYLVVCKNGIYITDNPPKKENLDNFISFDDITDIKTIDDVPKFLGKPDQDKAMHLKIKYNRIDQKTKNSMKETKNRIISLKKEMLYTKDLNEKIDMLSKSSTSYFTDNLTFRNFESTERTMNESLLLNTDRSKLDTAKSNKTVRFDGDTILNTTTTSDTNNTMNNNEKYLDKYSKLNKLVSQTIKAGDFLNTTSSSSVLNLSLPPTPRKINLPELVSFKSLESLERQSNLEFIQDSSKNFGDELDLYILNENSKIIEILKLAHFYSKIKSTLNYHQKSIEKSSKKINDLEKKFLQIKSEILASKDDIEMTCKLMDEIIRATRNYDTIKILFWNNPDFYRMIINEISRYLPKSPADMTSSRAPIRRIKELECCIAYVEFLYLVFNETEFYKNRFQVISEEKCKFLVKLVTLLLCDPELAIVSNESLIEESYFLNEKQQELVCDLTLVSSNLMFEILTFLKMASWSNEFFNLDLCIDLIEAPLNLSNYVTRLITELTKLVLLDDSILLSPAQTVIIFKIFSFFKIVLEKSSKKVLCLLLRDKFQEEFKYYFCSEMIQKKCFKYYPIMDDLFATITRLEKFILNN